MVGLGAFFLLSLQMHVYAQHDDFGTWTNVEVKKRILPRLDIAVEGDIRFRDDMESLDRWAAIVSMSYQWLSFFSVGANYNFIRFNHTKRGWETGHRYNLYCTASAKWNQWTVSLRERYEQTYRDGVESSSGSPNPNKVMRSRLMVAYAIQYTGFKPFLSSEFFDTVNAHNSSVWDKVWYTAGAEYKLNKRHSLQMYYRYQKIKHGQRNTHILGTGYYIRL